MQAQEQTTERPKLSNLKRLLLGSGCIYNKTELQGRLCRFIRYLAYIIIQYHVLIPPLSILFKEISKKTSLDTDEYLPSSLKQHHQSSELRSDFLRLQVHKEKIIMLLWQCEVTQTLSNAGINDTLPQHFIFVLYLIPN